ncbi:MAG TPA: SIS domain-containing protein [Propionibacteriaceae bacterium]|nr:SIS domain-containing protein [Propionibacteriaceae bacterium]
MDFDDSRLEDPASLADADDLLRTLASCGSRIRREAADLVDASGSPGPALAGFDAGRRPRGVIALGAEARLLRAVVEPICPVPFVAWTLAGLPGWVGPLDLVVVLASGGSDPDLVLAVREAVRRGCALILASPPGSPIEEFAGSRSTLLVPATTGDPLASAVVVLAVLHELGIGPLVRPESVAVSADRAAEACSPHRDLALNSAKDLALGVAEAQPLVWGGTVLAARAARRVSEGLRQASGRAALAADAAALYPVIDLAEVRDPFADPFDEAAAAPRPVLVVFDDRSDSDRARRERGELQSIADQRQVRVCEVSALGVDELSSDVDRYVSLLQQGLFASAYLGIGLGRDATTEWGA